MEEELLLRLRGKRIPYFLVSGETKLEDSSQYPYERCLVPVQCRLVGETLEPSFAYMSGTRSIVLPIHDHCFKAKATGIPLSVSQPIIHAGKLLTYHLTHEIIGSGNIIWGFSSIEEAEKEMFWMSKARELDLPSSDPIGIGIYKNVHVLDFGNRWRLVEYLRENDIQAVLKEFMERSRETTAACIFSKAPTDVRVDEIIYAFLFPGIDRVFDMGDCLDYLKWLGSSCGYNLRMHHDQGIMHGTVLEPPFNLSNSHLANHLSGESKTWMTDYHMAGGIEDERMKKEEIFYLCHLMNPLPSAMRIALERLGKGIQPMYPWIIDQPTSNGIQGLVFGDYPISFLTKHEKLTEALIKGLEHGYFKSGILEIESRLKREFFSTLVKLKEKMWELYDLPKAMQRGAEYVPKIVASTRVPKDKISGIVEFLGGKRHGKA